jgi:hypothetical protein
MFLFMARTAQLTSFKVSVAEYAYAGTYESVELVYNQYTAYCSRMYGQSPATNIVVIIRTDPSVTVNFQAGQTNSYTQLTNIQNVKRVYYLLFGTSDGTKVTDVEFLGLLTTFVDMIDSSMNEACSAEPALHKMQKLLTA